MRQTGLVLAVLATLLVTSPTFAAPKVQSLGTSGDVQRDSAAACESLAAAPWETGQPGTGLEDNQLYLDAAMSACQAAHDTRPDDPAIDAWLGRVALLLGKTEFALPLLQSADEAGRPLASYILAGLYEEARDGTVTYDPEKAQELLQKAANLGYVPALLELARRAETSSPPDYERALSNYTAAADAGDGHSLYKLGWMYHYGLGVAADVNRAKETYQRAIDAGSAEGWYGLGQILQNGDLGSPDAAGALEAYQKGADLSEPMSQTALAYFYEQGIGVAQDYSRSFALLTEAVDKDDAFAKAALAIHYLFGEGTDIDYAKAFELANAAANAGVNYAHGIVGYLYAEGLVTRRDLDQALTQFRTGAEGGDAYANGRIEVAEAELQCADLAASPFEFGGSRGVEFDALDAETAIPACRHAVDLNPGSTGDKVWLGRALLKSGATDEALPLIQAGVDNDNALAMTLMAGAKLDGSGVAIDEEEAAGLYQDAADAGFAPAMLELGKLYAAGRGVHRDAAAARRWLEAAGDQGVAGAADVLAQLDQGASAAGSALDGFAREGLAY